MTEYAVADADELDPGDRLLVVLEGREVGVFNLDGEYYAYLNWCAHQGGPLCEGEVTGRATATYDREALRTEVEWVGEGETLICPWHDWEYDLRTGDCVSNGDVNLPSYPVHVDDGEIVVTM
ncbi:MAG: Rieske (2Fe-2S) protein [Haloferacaceae archaeon]